MKNFKRHISITEKLSTVFIWVMFLMTLGVSLLFGIKLTVLLVIFGGCAVTLTFLLLTPLRYEFCDSELLIVNPRPLKDIMIIYKAVIKYDVVGSYWFSRQDIDAVEVIITYKTDDEKHRKTVCCHPKKVDKFIKILQENCPHIEHDPDE